MRPSYELFDHTADVGIHVFAATLPDLLDPATRGLYAVIGDLTGGRDAEVIPFDFSGHDAAMLLRDYLGELLILFERDGRFVTSLDVSLFDDTHLVARGRSRFVDQQRSRFHHEVKAVTYHALDIRSIPHGYEATVIVDI